MLWLAFRSSKKIQILHGIVHFEQLTIILYVRCMASLRTRGNTISSPLIQLESKWHRSSTYYIEFILESILFTLTWYNSDPTVGKCVFFLLLFWCIIMWKIVENIFFQENFSLFSSQQRHAKYAFTRPDYLIDNVTAKRNEKSYYIHFYRTPPGANVN